MTTRGNRADGPRRRQASARGYLMCPPEHFAVTYAINPWMEPEKPTDAANAMRQWAKLRQVYLDLGHDVRTIEPVAGLPDMVFAANGATVVGGKVLGARFRYPQRAREADAYLDWFCASGYTEVQMPEQSTRARATSCSPGARCWPGTASAATRPSPPNWRTCSGCRW